MELYLLKRDCNDGQSFYGVFDNKNSLNEALDELKVMYPRVKEFEYDVKIIKVNEITEIHSE